MHTFIEPGKLMLEIGQFLMEYLESHNVMGSYYSNSYESRGLFNTYTFSQSHKGN